MAFPLGMVGVIAGYVLLDRLGVGLQFGWNVALQLGAAALFAAAAWWRWRARIDDREAASADRGGWSELPRWGRWLAAGILAWLALRWLGIVVEVIHRPLFPWDAWYAYGAQAKVWFHVQRLDVFANFSDWFASTEPAWTAGGVRHPPGIGLIQLWTAQALGRWDDAVMNMPWPLALAGMAAVFAGFARLAGVSLLSVVIGLWVVMGLPVLDIQAVLAGYGDLWIAVYVLIAAGLGMLLRQGRNPWLILPLLVALVGMLMIKQVGLYWVCLIALGLVAGLVPLRRLLLLAGAGAVVALALMWWRDEPVTIGILGQFGFRGGVPVFPGYTPMWQPLADHLFVYPNWHLFWYLAVMAIPMLIIACRADYGLRVLVCTGLGGTLGLVALYAFSDLGQSVIDGTSVNRLLLHPVPVLGLGMLLVAAEWFRTRGGRS